MRKSLLLLVLSFSLLLHLTSASQQQVPTELSSKSKKFLNFLMYNCTARVLEDSLDYYFNAKYYQDKISSSLAPLKLEELAFNKAKIYDSLSQFAARLNQPTLSKDYLIKAIQYAEKGDDFEYLGWLNARMGHKARLGNFSENFQDYYTRALQYFEGINNAETVAEVLYIQSLRNSDEALIYLHNAIDILSKDDSKALSAKGRFAAMGKIFNCLAHYKNEIDDKLTFYEKAITHYQLANDSIGLAFAYNNIGYSHYLNSNYIKAIPWFKKALNISIEIGNKGLVRNSLNNLALAYHRVEDWETAFVFEYSKSWIHGSLLNDAFSATFTANKVKYELDKYELENNLLKKDQILKRNQNVVLGVVTSLLMIMVGGTVYSRRKIRIKNQTLNDQAFKLQALDRLKSRFFANISHELKTPLSLIKIPVGQLLGGETESIPKNTLRKKLMTVERNVEQLQRLIEEVLDLAKLKAGKIKVHKNPVMIEEFFELLLGQYKALIEAKNITLHQSIELGQASCVVVDHGKLSKIVNNLLSNAFKFTPEGGLIQLIVRVTEEQVMEISVGDSGVGIHQNDIPKIFDRYYQSERPEAKAEGGTGIGLALCKELVELQGGVVRVKSEIGKGSLFEVKIPVEIASEGITLKELENKESYPINLNEELNYSIIEYGNKFGIKPCMLIAEDHHELQVLLHELMLPYFEVVLAANGKKALEVLNSRRVDVLISDLMMPIMDGYELLDQIKKDASMQKVSIIMLTARSASEDKIKALNYGIDDYLTKPFDPQELVLRVLNLVKNRMLFYHEDDFAQDKFPVANAAHYQKTFGISSREFDVLQLLKQRLSNDEIAENLFISKSTVKFHIHNIFNKLGVKRRKEAYETLSTFEEVMIDN